MGSLSHHMYICLLISCMTIQMVWICCVVFCNFDSSGFLCRSHRLAIRSLRFVLRGLLILVRIDFCVRFTFACISVHNMHFVSAWRMHIKVVYILCGLEWVASLYATQRSRPNSSLPHSVHSMYESCSCRAFTERMKERESRLAEKNTCIEKEKMIARVFCVCVCLVFPSFRSWRNKRPKRRKDEKTKLLLCVCALFLLHPHRLSIVFPHSSRSFKPCGW